MHGTISFFYVLLSSPHKYIGGDTVWNEVVQSIEGIKMCFYEKIIAVKAFDKKSSRMKI